ncbi:hypothetical protein EYF80_060271 [Liparis tanakae]|uniref:Uncharacterized protein n=1 Tax=Liparis tanakae TaxID=230148 RepID=A0A4Z2ELZ1_9TELE|nr:hypothetical protein EYF80_060271 [Liparis tanakae]
MTARFRGVFMVVKTVRVTRTQHRDTLMVDEEDVARVHVEDLSGREPASVALRVGGREKEEGPRQWQRQSGGPEDRNGELGYLAQERKSLGDQVQEEGALGVRGQATRHGELEELYG